MIRAPRPVFAILFLAALLFAGGAAQAGTTSAPGCDDTGPAGGLWQSMKSRADSQRVRDAGYGRIVRQPSSAVAGTCFDLALSVSARIGGIFADVAGALDIVAPLRTWGEFSASINGVVQWGRANPRFFPADKMPPPMANLVRGAIGSLDAKLAGKMGLYNPFGNLGGLRVNLKTGVPDLNSLLNIYTKRFDVDMNDYLPNFRSSIAADLGLNVAGQLKFLADLLDAQFGAIPNFKMPALMVPDLALDAGFAACGAAVAASLGYGGKGPLQTLLDIAQGSLGKVLTAANKVLDVLGTVLDLVQGVMNAVKAVLALAGQKSVLGRAEASLSGINWPHFSLPLPQIAPGCLMQGALWAGKTIVKMSGNGDDLLSPTRPPLTDMDAADSEVTAQLGDSGPPGCVSQELYNNIASASAAGRAQAIAEGRLPGVLPTVCTNTKGISGGGPSGTEADNNSKSSLPFFSFDDMLHGAIQGAGADLTIGLNPDGGLTGIGEFSTASGAGILARAALDLDLNLGGPAFTLISSWKEPPENASAGNAATGQAQSGCDVIRLMPGAPATTTPCQ